MKDKRIAVMYTNWLKRIVIISVGLSLFYSCSTDKKQTALAENFDSTQTENITINGYYEGKALYEKTCANCHQLGGEPQVKLYPPLKNSDYLKDNQKLIPCIIRNGTTEDLTVNGQKYSIKMQGFPNYSAQEIMQLMNYINNSWGNNFSAVELDSVSKYLEKCQ